MRGLFHVKGMGTFRSLVMALPNVFFMDKTRIPIAKKSVRPYGAGELRTTPTAGLIAE